MAIETVIAEDAASLEVDPTVILLGDLVDRGPQSAQVLDHVVARVAERPDNYLCLAGNHEESMLEFLARPTLDHIWLANGGSETLLSYGVAERDLARAKAANAILQSRIPNEHLDMLQSLPVAAELPKYFFCHAGIREGIALTDQRDEDLEWIRDGMASRYDGCDKTVVHGHQPQAEPVVLPRRINVDTGAYATGRLSAVRLGHGDPVALGVTRTGRANNRRDDEIAHS